MALFNRKSNESGSSDSGFEDRMFLASEAIYARIERGECTDVEAALLDAHLGESEEGA